MGWRDFDGGKTLGERGSERGVILIDEEHDAGARITLERDGVCAPFAITCGVYGWLMHTRFFDADVEARGEFDAMKLALAELAVWEPAAGGDDTSEMIDVMHAFVERFP